MTPCGSGSTTTSAPAPQAARGDCLGLGVNPVIAYQPLYLQENPSPTSVRRFASWWGALARHYAGWPRRLSFDLILEVQARLSRSPSLLNRAYSEALAAVRRSDPCRIVFLAPPGRDSPDYLGLLRVPDDPYVMVEWHFYAAGPSPTNPRVLWTTGTPAEKRLILRRIEEAVAWSRRTGVPTWVGAWMPSDYNHGNHYTIEQQVEFATFMSCALRRAGIPYAVNADVQFYDIRRRGWVRSRLPVLEAVLRPRCG